MLLILADL
jgi:U3 small nucleolar RNA-associated protein 24